MKTIATFEYEDKLWKSGAVKIAGIDEVGRGAWAGPVVASAVVFPPFSRIDFDLYDSKLLTEKQRQPLAEKIYAKAKVGIGLVHVPTINKIGIGKATQKAFRAAVNGLGFTCDYYLVDAFYIRYWSKENQIPIKKGDQIVASIAAASIVAKVYRDEFMKALHKKYPQYGLATHKGYGTADHQAAISKFKLSGIHRKSFNLDFLLV